MARRVVAGRTAAWWTPAQRAGVLALVCTLAPVRAVANERARCEALLAQARSTAAILRAPRVEASVLRSPTFVDAAGLGTAPEQGAQARAGLAFSPVGVLRGARVMETAEAECERLLAREAVEAVLRQGAAYGRNDALREQLAVLERGLPRVDELVEAARVRFERSLITVFEFDELRHRRLGVLTRLGELRQELALVEEAGVGAADGIAAALSSYERSALAADEGRAALRKLDAWAVDMRGGATPYPQGDWYAAVSVGWSLGALFQGAAEADARRAGETALATDSDELRPRIERFRRAMRESAAALAAEQDAIDKRVALARERLTADSDSGRQLLANLEVEMLELTARRSYIARLRAAREAAGTTTEP